ncbi:MAG: tetratricopeptide repeat protein, partial [Spirochaeta sp.]|nr:tetratricopeptide repeat protein [Spirochaeta sp.]
MTKSQLSNMLHLAENALRISDYETAEQYALEARNAAPKSVQVGMLLGTVYGRLERYEEAVKEFRRVLKIAPKNAEALNNLGVMYRFLGRTEEARKALQGSLELSPERADVLYNLGNIHKAAGEFDEAVKCYERAIETDPSFVLAYNNLGTIFQKQGEHNQAVEVFNNGLQHDLNHPTLRYNLGISYDALGKLPDARRQFEHALRSRPGWTDALNNLGIVLEKLERYDESIRQFKEVLDIDEKNHVARNNIATVLARQGNTEDAFSYYADSLRADPTYERAAANLGNLFEKNPPKDSDFDVLKNIYEHAPQNTEFQFQYAKALMGAQRYEEAEQAVERTQIKATDDPRTLRMTGLLKYRRGDKEGAEKDFSRLRELDPGHVDHHLDLAEMLMQSGDTQGALTEVNTLLKQRPDNLQAGVIKADVLTRGGRPKDAVKLLKKLKKKNPESVETLSALSRAHQTLGEREKAIGALDELINIQGNRGTPDDINALNKSLELYEEAARSLADEHSDDWQRNLDKLSRYARSHDTGQPEEDDQELHVESLDGQDEDSVSPWDLGPQTFQADAEEDSDLAPAEPEEEEPETDEWEPELPPAMRDMIESGSMPFGDQDRSGSGHEAESDEIPFMRDFPPQMPSEPVESVAEPRSEPYHSPEPQRQPGASEQPEPSGQ